MTYTKFLSNKALSNNQTILFFIAYTFLLLFFCSHMSPVYYSNEWADVNIYFNIGKMIFNGKVLYTDAFDHKGPLIFFIYGIGYLISKDSFIGMFFIQWFCWFILVYFVYKSAKLYLNNTYAYIVAAAIPIFLIKIMKAGGSAEEFILVFECVSLYYFLLYFKDKDASVHKPRFMLIHGIMCSLTFFIKFNLIAFWFFPLAAICINLLLKKEFKNLFLNLLMFLVGFGAIAAPIILYFVYHGALQDAYFVYIELNTKYAEVQGVEHTLMLTVLRIMYLFIEPFVLFCLPLVGILYFPLKYIENKIGKYAILLAGGISYVMIFCTPVFQVYYPIVFLPFSVLGLIGVFLIIDKYIVVKRTSIAFILGLSCLLMYMGLSQAVNLDKNKIAGELIDKNPGLLTQRLHDEIIKVENPTLMNIGFGLGNSLFTTCNIMPNVRYFISPNITYESYPRMRDEQTKYIQNKEVDFVLLPIEIIIPGTDVSTKVQNRRKVNNYKYFEELPALKENYTLALTDTLINLIDDRNFEIYKLYKLKGK